MEFWGDILADLYLCSSKIRLVLWITRSKENTDGHITSSCHTSVTNEQVELPYCKGGLFSYSALSNGRKENAVSVVGGNSCVCVIFNLYAQQYLHQSYKLLFIDGPYR